MALEALDLVEIERCMEGTECGVRLVPDRLLRRVIKYHRRLSGVGYDVPHAGSYVLPADELLAIADENELGHRSEELPDSVILLPRPEKDTSTSREEVVVALWRAAFHASVHRELERARQQGALSAEQVRAKIHAIGQIEFDEIRLVLRQDDALLPPDDDISTYVEFAATYLELRAFAPHDVALVFPALGDAARVDVVVGADVDRERLLAASRPVNAPLPEELAKLQRPMREDVTVPVKRSEAHADDAAVTRSADAAKAKGNGVRSMLLRVGVRGTETDVRNELEAMMNRLAKTLGWKDAPVVSWTVTLLPVLNMAAGATLLLWNVEARLLYDLQAACVDRERELYTVSLVEWALGLGRRPLKRPLPMQREVRILKHFDAAIAKLPKTAVPEPQRGAVLRLLKAWRKRAELNLRALLGPSIEEALREVGLEAANAPERISRRKLVEELLDAVVAHGQISLGHLRDALARSSVKMHNLRAGEIVSGDALLRADLLLSRSLDGVYRRGEIYLRTLQKVSSFTFGTRLGRLATLYLILPLVAGYVVLSALEHTLGHFVITGMLHKHVEFMAPAAIGGVSAAVFALLHFQAARDAATWVLALLGSGLRALFLKLPGWLLRHPVVRAILSSDPVVVARRLIVKPALLAGGLLAPLWFFVKNRLIVLAALGAVFVVLNVLLNSRSGMLIEEAVTDWMSRNWRMIRRRVLPGVFGLVMAFFRRVLEIVDRSIYRVDELLRFREGESRAAFYGKAFASVIWFFVTYLIRVYVNLLIEPYVNPIKHFPVVTVAAKIMLPMTQPMHDGMFTPLKSVIGPVLAESVTAPTVFVAPGIFGFLAWELGGNWRLYDQNRPASLPPTMIGSHGETMGAFLKPGLHSGTVPKLYAKLRRATLSRSRSALKHREALAHVEEAVRCFAERELVPLLFECKAWRGGRLEVGPIDVASNRIRIELVCEELGPEGVRVAFEEQSGWLVGGIAQRGFLDRLDADQRVVFENLLAGLYKLAGVEIVREQVAAVIGALPYDVSDDGLVVWPDGSYKASVTYDLRARGALLPGRATHGLGVLPPMLEARKVLFRHEPVAWTEWIEAWSERSTPPARIVKGPTLLGIPSSAGG